MSRMVVKKSPRLGLDTWSEGTDLHPNRAEWNAQQLILDDLTAIDVEVPTWDARPQTAVRGTYMWVVDEQRLYRRTATGWQTTARIGGGGRGEVVRVGGAGEAAEGSSPIAARADHTHSIPVATRSTPGAMSAEDKTTLDLHRLPTRNDLVTRSLNSITAEGVYYLDAYSWATTDNGYPTGAQGDRGVLVVYRVSYSSTRVIQEWTALDQRRRWIRSGTGTGAGDWSAWVELASTARATPSSDGLMPSADKAMLDTATSNSTGNALMRRDSGGRVYVSTPAAAGHAATKGYVDGLVVTSEQNNLMSIQSGWTVGELYYVVYGKVVTIYGKNLKHNATLGWKALAYIMTSSHRPPLSAWGRATDGRDVRVDPGGWVYVYDVKQNENIPEFSITYVVP